MAPNRFDYSAKSRAPISIGVWFCALCLLFSTVLVGITPRFALASVDPNRAKDRIVVKYKHPKDRSHAAGVAKKGHGTVRRTIGDRTAAISVAPDHIAESLTDLRNDSDVLWAEQDGLAKVATVPNDPCYVSCTFSNGGTPVTTSQYGLPQVKAPAAWGVTKGSSSIKVAVLDTGVSKTHPQLTSKVDYGPNLSDSATDDDVYGHGSHVAGIIGAKTDDGVTVAGIGWNTRVLAVKVMDDDGTGYMSDIADGIEYATDHGAQIINMSLTGGPSPALADAVSYAQDNNVLIVAAAGNADGTPGEDLTVPNYPAAYSGVLSVASVNSSDALSSFSYRGSSWVDVAAPGEDIISTYTGTAYALFDGTSMATPLVAGAAALVLAANPTATAQGLRTRIIETADHIAASGSGVYSGRLNVGAAVGAPGDGLWLTATDGGVFALGENRYYGSMGGKPLNRPIVGGAATPDGKGYWLVASDGGIFTFGNAKFKGSTGSIALNKPIVGMASTPSGNGYWLVASDGGIFSFGDAKFKGSTGSLTLNKPIVGMAPTGSGNGYWLVASDGGIFTFGDAKFKGSTGSLKLVRPIVHMSPTKSGNGYWMVASDGGIFTFGDAPYKGSAASSGQEIADMARSRSGSGYWIVSTTGKIFAYGDAPTIASVNSAFRVVKAMN